MECKLAEISRRINEMYKYSTSLVEYEGHQGDGGGIMYIPPVDQHQLVSLLEIVHMQQEVINNLCAEMTKWQTS